MRFKHGSATITAKNSKQGAIILDVVLKLGGVNFSVIKQIVFDKKFNLLIKKMEVKANKIFAKNSRNKQQGEK